MHPERQEVAVAHLYQVVEVVEEVLLRLVAGVAGVAVDHQPWEELARAT